MSCIELFNNCNRENLIKISRSNLNILSKVLVLEEF